MVHKLRFLSETRNRRRLRGALLIVATLVTVSIPAAVAWQASPQHADGVAIQGTVLDSAHNLVVGASVRLELKGAPGAVVTRTNAAGAFVFPTLGTGSYVVTAEKAGLRSGATAVVASSQGEQKKVELVLESSGAEPDAASPSSGQAMEFTDKPNFTVAGVTDWTAVGGHGSDTILRTSESLARETLTLKPEGTGSTSGASVPNESESKLRAALVSAPGSFEANHQLGEFYLHAGRYREALSLLQATYQIDPANAGNEYDLALAYKENGDYSQAREHVQKLLAQKDSADLHRL